MVGGERYVVDGFWGGEANPEAVRQRERPSGEAVMTWRATPGGRLLEVSGGIGPAGCSPR